MNDQEPSYASRKGSGARERSKVKFQMKLNEYNQAKADDFITALKNQLKAHASLAFPAIMNEPVILPSPLPRTTRVHFESENFTIALPYTSKIEEPIIEDARPMDVTLLSEELKPLFTDIEPGQEATLPIESLEVPILNSPSSSQHTKSVQLKRVKIDISEKISIGLDDPKISLHDQPICHVQQNICHPEDHDKYRFFKHSKTRCTEVAIYREPDIIVYSPPGFGKTTLLQDIRNKTPRLDPHFADTQHSFSFYFGRTGRIIFTSSRLLNCGATLVIKHLPSLEAIRRHPAYSNVPIDGWYQDVLCDVDPPNTIRVHTDQFLGEFLEFTQR